MRRLVSWGVVLGLALTGCTVPSLEELEKEQPRACNAQHACGEGQSCINGFCEEFSCDAGAPVTGYLDADRDGHAALDAPPRAFCGTVPAGYATVNDDCDDAQATKYPGHTELCDGLDNDCDGDIDDGHPRAEYFRDVDNDGVGAGPVVPACLRPAGYVTSTGDCDDADFRRTPGKTEVCNDTDDDCDEQTDEGFDKAWYLDADGDSFGAESSLVMSCTKPSEQHVRATSRFDCRDDLAERNPNAMEMCNGEDDDCSGMADERFMTGPQALGASCLNDNICVGKYVCNMAQNGTACDAPAPTRYYVDRDGDGEGAAGSAAERLCPGDTPPAGWVANQQDCDDADPGTKMTATEVCDAIDNDCNGTLDDATPVCSGVMRRIYDQAMGDGHLWRTVAVDPTDGYPVWFAGMEGVLAMRRTPGAALESFDRGCGSSTTERATDWYAAWVNPANGNVFLVGENGRLAEHAGGAVCGRFVDVPLGVEHAFTGIMGVGSGATLTLFIVSEQGRLFSWQPGSSAPAQLHNSEGHYRGVYVLSPDLLIAVGTVNEVDPLAPRIYEHSSTNWGLPTIHTLNGTTGYVGSLRAISMTSAARGVAVGDDGLVLMKDGAAPSWTRVAPPQGVTPDFTSVALRAGSNDTYMVDNGAPGRLWRLTPFGWAKAPAITPFDAMDPPNVDRPLYDIAMTSTGEFWMVGDNGRIYHYPQP